MSYGHNITTPAHHNLQQNRCLEITLIDNNREKYEQFLRNRKFMEDKVKSLIQRITNNENDANNVLAETK